MVERKNVMKWWKEYFDVLFNVKNDVFDESEEDIKVDAEVIDWRGWNSDCDNKSEVGKGGWYEWIRKGVSDISGSMDVDCIESLN